MKSPHSMSPLPTQRDSVQAGVGALLLVGVTLIVFASVVSNRFTWWDDQRTIHHNNQFNPPTARGIMETWKKPAYGLYIPLTYSFWGALAHVAETRPDEMGIHLDPRVYHAASLVLHIASVLVVFAILRLLGGSVWPSTIGAMLFAIHPVQVEPVAWASGAKDLLAGLLSFCAIHNYLVFARLPESSRGQRRVYYISGCLLLGLAMLAKPSAVVTPIIVALLDGLVLRRPWKQAGWCSAQWLVLVLPLAIVTRLAQSAQGVADVAMWQRPLIAADAIAFYLGKLLWPATLAPDYGRRPAVVLAMGNGVWIAVAWIVPALVTWLAWRIRQRVPALWAGWLVFVAGLLPVLGFVPFMFQYMSTVADHYLYVSMLGAATVVMAGVSFVIERFRERSASGLGSRSLFTPAVRGGLAVAAIACMLGARSATQVRVWKDDVSLWTHTLAVCPDSFTAPNNLAAHLGRTSGVLAEAISEMTDADTAAGAQAQRQAMLRQAVELLEQCVRINPDYPAARHNAFVNYMRLGDVRNAVRHVEAMLASMPGLPPHLREDCTPHHHTAGVLWMRLKDYPRAAAHFQAALDLTPRHPTARLNLAEANMRIEEARVE